MVLPGSRRAGGPGPRHGAPQQVGGLTEAELAGKMLQGGAQLGIVSQLASWSSSQSARAPGGWSGHAGPRALDLRVTTAGLNSQKQSPRGAVSRSAPVSPLRGKSASPWAREHAVWRGCQGRGRRDHPAKLVRLVMNKARRVELARASALTGVI